jgi:hypothetical protein
LLIGEWRTFARKNSTMFTPIQDHFIQSRRTEPHASRRQPGSRLRFNLRYSLQGIALCTLLIAALVLSALNQFLFFRELALSGLIFGLTRGIQSTQGARLQINRKISNDTVSSKK